MRQGAEQEPMSVGVRASRLEVMPHQHHPPLVAGPTGLGLGLSLPLSYYC